MKSIYKLALPSLICLSATAIAQPQVGDPMTTGGYYEQQNSNNSKDLAKYLQNLGLYFGYDLTQKPQNEKNDQLIDLGGLGLIHQYIYTSVIGASPVTALSQALSYFVPSSDPLSQYLNPFANYTFKNQQYNAPAGAQQGKVTSSILIDQHGQDQGFQPDPVDQAVLNILTTPSNSYCMDYQGNQYQKDCSLLTQYKVFENVLGAIPGSQEFFAYDYNLKILGQLNSNSLTAPLLYSTQGTESTGSPSGQSGQNKGLTADNQAQNAANFIRYASAQVTPPALPKWKDYDTVYQKAKNNDKDAQATLAKYLTSLRVYTAQASVGFANLYSILSKRMPQNMSSSSTGNQTSQALSEFNMATWRLYSPVGSAGGQTQMQPNEQWINKINKASPASVQKEMAVLLAEINYQLYLNRQQEERLLLTNTIIMMQSAKNPPSTEFASQNEQ